MQRDHPNHYLWEHNLFQDSLYVKFRGMNATQPNNKMDEILNHISGISTGRALLNINITIPADGDYQVSKISTTVPPSNGVTAVDIAETH
ncbi:hypothetical protein BD408DRAFT_430075 [Parasitella parasitica]|nr:hypothetical protein BD408DRAFT_430075 [Parasitella parasitica]